MSIPGNLYILTAPSGAGKTTLARQLVASVENMQLSVSYTTRSPRLGEVQGRDYFFIATETFQQMIEEGAFLEWASVHHCLYGTSFEQTSNSINAGIDVVLAIDWQGAQKIRQIWQDAREKRNIGGKVISIFILPPSKQILQQRLHLRGQDNEQVIDYRLKAASAEIAHYKEFDYLVINDVLEKALEEIQSIVRASRLSSEAQGLRHKKLLAQWL